MKCRKNVKRIEEICAELSEIIDDSRGHCESDECELIHCVVHDCVQKMQRAVTRWHPEAPVDVGSSILETPQGSDRVVN